MTEKTEQEKLRELYPTMQREPDAAPVAMDPRLVQMYPTMAKLKNARGSK